jgi:hypothetical protein
MAKYVLVEFDRDEDADAFADTLQGPDTTVRAIGLYKKPTQFCECPNSGEKSAFGQKWGWFVHKDCGKPRKGVYQGPKNLLDPNTPHGRRNPILSIREPR